ncbi:DUF6268 family outer membrane beta-barrel protein [Orrella daihaiensis]|uniref:DUF6268 domain-containing protein n=1 Tax=Orrella daihaiensis TaxID=2782176 RepID=A0ABY4ALA6_9BURK|nr:DUF6268 family outer membrane beta-barrel protein [Orrella daihaiensis]UOD51081.1 hypothetical protein DHf2319_04030 [Orrella daihaiensis]
MKLSRFQAMTAFSLVLAGVGLPASGQPMQTGQTITSFSLTGFNQFKTDMNEGGSFNWYEANARLGLNRQFTPNWGVGLFAEYGYQHWSWSDPVAFGGESPWTGISTPQLGFSVSYSPTAAWRFSISPSIEWAAETGVGTANASTYGAVFLGTHTISPNLTLGLGAGVFRQINENRVFPFLAVNWRINDQWTLSNPLPAGPAGGAGLELSYKIDNQWTVGAGGAYRSYRFRLNDNGPYAGGIGQNRVIPVFARVSYQLMPGTRIDLYGVASTGGNVQAQSADGSQTWNSDYKTGLGLGLNLSHRF